MAKKNTNLITGIIVSAIVVAGTVVVGSYIFYEHFGSSDKSGIPNYSKEFHDEISSLDTHNTKEYYTDYSPTSKLEDIQAELERAEINKDTEFYDGSRLNILVTGVDSRIGTRYRHADANHILSIDFATRTIDLVSVPRDTPTDRWHIDTVLTDSNEKIYKRYKKYEAIAAINGKKFHQPEVIDSNFVFSLDDLEEMYIKPGRFVSADTFYTKITEYLPLYGRDAYMDQVEAIAGIEKIHYWVEFGFSQAQGLMEFMGHEDPKTSLQVLRSRKVMKTGDFQRCYNQAQFIRQMFIKYFHKLDGVSGSLIMRGGLALVESNMSYKQARGIYKKLIDNHFVLNSSNITVTVKPSEVNHYKYFDFTDTHTMDSLRMLVNEYSSTTEHENAHNSSNEIERLVKNKLDSAIEKAIRDSSRSAQYVINDLKVLYKQHAWLQLSGHEERNHYRTQISELLIDAYGKKNNRSKIEEIKYTIQAEKALLDNQDELNSELENQ